MEKDAADIETTEELVAGLRFYLRAALEYIDAVPREAVDALARHGFW